MTSFRIERLQLDTESVKVWAEGDPRHRNWPVVYTLNNARSIYVGESLNAATRMNQHIANKRGHLQAVRVVVDDRFNKSVCLDLESYLIRLFAGDGRYTVENRNEGITNADYYARAEYEKTFNEIFESLRKEGMFDQTIPQIENSDLFKLSPFKALTQEQAGAVNDILEGLFDDLEHQRSNTIVVQGDPGTGKTIVAIYLMKLLSDIRAHSQDEVVESDSIFAEYFLEGYPELLRDFRVGLVVPQQSLRKSIQRVFAKTPGLAAAMVLTPFDVGFSEQLYDLLIVDEAHRLSQRANQSSGVRNRDFQVINERLFGADDPLLTQLDWIIKQSRHQIFLIDAAQSVRPGDLPPQRVERLLAEAKEDHRLYPLATQMRVAAGEDYVGYVRRMLSTAPPLPMAFGEYDFRMFDRLGDMLALVREKENQHRLARVVAGFAWPWVSKNSKSAYDIHLDGEKLRWNSTAVDWINSPKSVDEVGSIHTVQGYDLNYAGVIIGPELKYDAAAERLMFDRSCYHDKKGMENNKTLGITYSDEQLLEYVVNVYGVLLTRGMRGTYVYVCDRALREHLRPYFEA
ncbi:DNA/RNA helicase domain-containing protein [Sinomonas sp. B1-1]|uniref:DNA/RNA helicase domain-containing protein n=1 Tax=Sinomonas sp. B1-1 TaxID=3141454 RepID=UPI003D2CEEF7